MQLPSKFKTWVFVLSCHFFQLKFWGYEISTRCSTRCENQTRRWTLPRDPAYQGGVRRGFWTMERQVELSKFPIWIFIFLKLLKIWKRPGWAAEDEKVANIRETIQNRASEKVKTDCNLSVMIPLWRNVLQWWADWRYCFSKLKRKLGKWLGGYGIGAIEKRR